MVSIITCCYNSEINILNSINSIKSQFCNEYEHIIIDGNSTDKTIDLINSIKHNKIKVFSENDNGIYDALNKGIKISTGNIIGILHSDDLFTKNNILEQVAEIFIKTNCDGVYGDLNFVKDGKIVRKWESCIFKLPLLNKGWMPAHPTLFLKKEIFVKHGLYDTDFKIAADYDFILRIFKDESLKFEYLPITITNMSIGGVSTSGFRNLIRKSVEDYMILKKNKMKFPLLILFRKIVSKISQFYAI